MTLNSEQHSIVAIFDSHTEAEAALKGVQNAGLDVRQVSVVAKDFYSEEQAVGFYTSLEQLEFWGVRRRFWGSLWEMLSGAAFLFIPTVGSLVVVGPLVGWVARVLEADPLASGSGVLGGALSGIGISNNGVSNYETAVKLGEFTVLAGGTPDMIVRARTVLRASGPAQLSASER